MFRRLIDRFAGRCPHLERHFRRAEARLQRFWRRGGKGRHGAGAGGACLVLTALAIGLACGQSAWDYVMDGTVLVSLPDSDVWLDGSGGLVTGGCLAAASGPSEASVLSICNGGNLDRVFVHSGTTSSGVQVRPIDVGVGHFNAVLTPSGFMAVRHSQSHPKADDIPDGTSALYTLDDGRLFQAVRRGGEIRILEVTTTEVARW